MALYCRFLCVMMDLCDDQRWLRFWERVTIATTPEDY